jgi:glycosyltransferase involved in cell wall biosynthesis
MGAKYRVLFFDNSTRLKTIHDLETRGRGGMVASLFKVSDYLSSAGHDVYVLSDIEENGKTPAGAVWIGKGSRIPHEETFDFLIHNRGADDGLPEIKARRRILWTHDLPHAGHIPEPKTIKAFSATVFMSEYAERIWRCYYRDIGRSFLIPNGVDKKLFYPRDKARGYLIFASAPNRGLKRLPLIFEAIRSRVEGPIFMKAFSNMKALHPNEVRSGEDDGFSMSYKSCREVGIDLVDPVPQRELAEELGSAGLMILPTDYPEICSNIILQSLASGTPIITTGGVGSAREWIKDGVNGRLTRFQPIDYMIHSVEIVRMAVEVLNDERLHRRLIKGALQTKIETWEAIGAKWEKMLNRLY